MLRFVVCSLLLVCITSGKEELKTDEHERLGCWKDEPGHPAIAFIEGTSLLLDGDYKTRTVPLLKCSLLARLYKNQVFALQDGGKCAMSKNALKTFNKYGESTQCFSNGTGGPEANEVYKILEV
ncbi:unnamed protein product [Clavelina lepadiformis]|uniref:Secreted protein n=1 Tax=Clavelina lepadiformis TaxID=159417 RepID=A0ABP0FD86_CLALP